MERTPSTNHRNTNGESIASSLPSFSSWIRDMNRNRSARMTATSSIIILLPSSSASTFVSSFTNNSSHLLLLTDKKNCSNYPQCRIIVPYIARHLFPLTYIYLVGQEDDEEGEHHPHEGRHHNDNDRHNNRHQRPLFVFVTLTSHYPNNVMITNDIVNDDNDDDDDDKKDNNYNYYNNATSNNSYSKSNTYCTTTTSIQTSENANRDSQYASPSNKVFNDIPGLLENILSYLHAKDIIQTTSYINKRFYNASRNNDIWKCICIYEWKDKFHAPKVRNRNRVRIESRRKSSSSNRGSSGKKRKRNEKITRSHYCYNYNQSQNNNNNGRHHTNYNDIALFWRMKINPNIIYHDLSIQEMKYMLYERPLGRKEIRDCISSCIEKEDLIQLILDYMPLSLGGDDDGMSITPIEVSTGEGEPIISESSIKKDNDENDSSSNRRTSGSSKRKNHQRVTLTKGFEHLWFGSYASSIIDSKRTYMTIDELVSLSGFSMNSKIIMMPTTTTTTSTTSRNATTSSNVHNNHRNNNDNTTTNSQHRPIHHEDIQLHFHCMCYFDEDYQFRMESDHDIVRDGQEEDNDGGDGEGIRQQQQQRHFHQNRLTWKWIEEGRILQVGQYAPLHVHRTKKWGWKLENCHVVLLSH